MNKKAGEAEVKPMVINYEALGGGRLGSDRSGMLLTVEGLNGHGCVWWRREVQVNATAVVLSVPVLGGTRTLALERSRDRSIAQGNIRSGRSGEPVKRELAFYSMVWDGISAWRWNTMWKYPGRNGQETEVKIYQEIFLDEKGRPTWVEGGGWNYLVKEPKADAAGEDEVAEFMQRLFNQVASDFLANDLVYVSEARAAIGRWREAQGGDQRNGLWQEVKRTTRNADRAALMMVEDKDERIGILAALGQLNREAKKTRRRR